MDDMALFIPKRIFIHHSLTKDSGTVSWGAIRKYHTEVIDPPWSDIGYHAGVEMVKSGEEIYHEVLMGRMWDVRGAHCRGHNHDSLSICFIGNYDKRPPGQLILKAGAKVIALWLKLFNLSIDDIYSHHNFDIHKTCPGKMFDMESLLRLIKI